MTEPDYRYARDCGIYLDKVDSSWIGDRRPVARESMYSPCVLLIIGQSNGGNHGDMRFSANEAVFNFNPFDRQIYPARDPLLGATGDGGSPWCLMADALIRDGFSRSILLCPLNVGGARVAEWTPGRPYDHRMLYAIAGLRSADFTISHVLWHLGEADALYGTTADAYIRSFNALATSLRREDIDAPIWIATASYFSDPPGYESSQAIIRAAQQSLVDPERAILAGPDTDAIKDRYDGCHMGGDGLRQHAAAWHAALMSDRYCRDRPVRTAAIG
jgi:hypothetical protein